MRLAMLLVALTLFVAAQAHAQPTYVLLDRSSSISKTETNAAKGFVEERLKPLADDAPVSLTYFGGNNGGDCKAPVKIEPAIAKARISVVPPTASGSTPIFAALEAAVPLAAANAGEVFVVTDGREGCGVNLCAAVKKLRAEYPKVPITFRTVGEEQRDLDAQDELGCLSAITSADVFTNTINVPVVTPPDDPKPKDFGQWLWGFTTRWYWLFVFLLFAGAAILLSYHFSACSVLLEQLVQGHKEHKPENQTVPADGQPAASPAPDVTTNTKPEKSLEQTLAAREKKTEWKRWGKITFWLGFGFLFALLFFECHFLDRARDAGWRVVNSDFANAFAVLELSVIGFAGLEFWRYIQLKREHAVISGELKRQTDAENFRRKGVLFEAYGRQRKSVQRVSFSTPWAWQLAEGNRENLKVVLDGLLGRAINPASTAENVTDAQIADLRRYAPTFGGWDMQKFAAQLLEDERISDEVFRDIEDFFEKLLRFRQPDSASEVLARLAAYFRPATTTAAP
jgi:hypothetical protein